MSNRNFRFSIWSPFGDAPSVLVNGQGPGMVDCYVPAMLHDPARCSAGWQTFVGWRMGAPGDFARIVDHLTLRRRGQSMGYSLMCHAEQVRHAVEVAR